ncbi:MAG TPA: acyltransferase [Cellulomonas sp.]
MQEASDRIPTGAPTRLPGLDALRGLAVGLVLLNHAAPQVFSSAGVVGVTIFFALSGYLITGVLVRDLDARGRIRFGRFFGHRALRLLPPLVLMLIGYTVVEGVFDLMGERDLVAESWLAALTYTINIPGLPHGSESLYHFWTLATEEQFYLVWPLVLTLAWRRGVLRLAVATAAVLVLVGCTVSMLLVAPDIARVYALPTSWGTTLLVGAAGYLGRDALRDRLPATAGARRTVQVGLVLALGVAALGGGGFAQHPWAYLLGAPAAAAATVVLISYAGRWDRLPTRLLRPAVVLGTISYAAYLWNAAIARWLGNPDDLTGAVLGVVLTLAAASASWWLVERPAARVRRWLDRRSRVRDRALLLGGADEPVTGDRAAVGAGGAVDAVGVIRPSDR